MNNGSHRFGVALLRALFGLIGDRRGNIAAMTALLIVPLVGAMGLAIESADWYLNQRAAQNAADSAALSASLNKGTVGGTSCAVLPGDFDCEAKAAAAQFGFVNGANNVTVTVTCTAKTLTGSCAAGTCPGGATQCYTVAITKKVPLALMQLVGYQGDTTISGAKAVTIYASATGQPAAAAQTGGCLLALGSSNQSGAISVTGAADIESPNCGVYDNSTSPTALIAQNSGTIRATSINVAGGDSTSGAPVLSPAPNLHSTAVGDPYSGTTAPVAGGCDQTAYSLGNGNKQTINANGSTPYVFCNGLAVTGAGQLTLGAGTYIINGGSFAVTNGTTFTATSGTTIYLTGGATMTLNGGSVIAITAPSTGTYAGIGIWDNASSNPGGTVSFSNGATLTLIGLLYLPNHVLNVSGGFTNAPGKCTQIIADQITATNGITLNSTCANTGVKPIGTSGNSGSATQPRLIL